MTSPSGKDITPSKAITPSEVPRSGETKVSPAGRFPPVPGAVKSPSSDLAFLPFSPTERSVPPGAVTWAETALSSLPFSVELRRRSSA